MVKASPEVIARRIAALRDSRTFVEAAGRTGEALSTFKTWCKRNEPLIRSRLPNYRYEDYLTMTEGELTARRLALKKATEAARHVRRTGIPRPGRVRTRAAPAPTGTMSLADAAQLIIREVDQVARLKDELNLARARVEELESKLGNEKQVDNLLIQIEKLEAENKYLTEALRDARAAAKKAGAVV